MPAIQQGVPYHNPGVADDTTLAVAAANAAAETASGVTDPDLITIEGIDATQSGVLATDGSGWIRKAYSAVKTSLSLTKSDVGLSNVDNTADASKPVSTAQQTALDAKVTVAQTAAPVLFASFAGDTDQKLMLYTSAHGKVLHDLSANPVFDPGIVRDPSIIFTNNAFYVAYTTYTNSTTSFDIAKSTDLLTWTKIVTVDCSAATSATSTSGSTATGTGGVATWAPDFFTDDNGDIYIYVAINTKACYWMKATSADLTTWTTPALLSGSGFPANIIDFSVIKVGSTYHMFYKNETTGQKYIERATSTSPTGPFTVVNTGDWAGWGSGVEGPKVLKIGPSQYRMWFDAYAASNGLQYSDSSDLTTWTTAAAVKIGINNVKSQLRHIGAVALNNIDAMGVVIASRHAVLDMGLLLPVEKIGVRSPTIYQDGTSGQLNIMAGNPMATDGTYSGSGITRISVVGSSRTSSPGSIFYTALAGTSPNFGLHQLEIDGGTGNFKVKNVSGNKVVVVPPSNTTANRPTAANAGAGAHMFDTTLNKPIWSDGTNWKDAAGTTV